VSFKSAYFLLSRKILNVSAYMCIPKKELVFLFSLYLTFNNSWDPDNLTPCLVDRILVVFVCLKLLKRTTFLFFEFSLFVPLLFISTGSSERVLILC